jgi:hypothetical protein
MAPIDEREFESMFSNITVTGKRQKHGSMSVQDHRKGGGGDDKCKVRQISVLFPGMDEVDASVVAKQGLKLIPRVSTVVFLKIDENKKNYLKEMNVGIRMFFHASESRRKNWWINRISRLYNGGEQFLVNRKNDRHAGAHLKLWENEQYSIFSKDDFFTFDKSKMNDGGNSEVNFYYGECTAGALYTGGAKWMFDIHLC